MFGLGSLQNDKVGFRRSSGGRSCGVGKTELGRLTPDGRSRIERLLASGRKQSDIAEELGITPPAVSRHVRRLAKIPRSLS
jgi:DNA-binding NarL/FixJ family response regulator